MEGQRQVPVNQKKVARNLDQNLAQMKRYSIRTLNHQTFTKLALL